MTPPDDAARDGARDWSDCFDVQPDGVVLRVHVQPRAGRSGVVGRHGDALKLRAAAPRGRQGQRGGGRARGRDRGVAPAAVTIVSGRRSRSKRVRIAGVDPGHLSAAIDAAVASRP